MPRKRRQPKARHQLTPTLADFTLREKLLFLSGWHPGTSGTRWRTWAEYLADYQAVRLELHERFRTGAKAAFPEPYAEAALRILTDHGAEALDATTYQDIRDARRVRGYSCQ